MGADGADHALEVLVRRPDVGVLSTDVNMPGRFDGLGLTRRAHERWPKVRIVVASGRDIRSDQVPDESCFVRWPYQVGQITQAIDGLCGWVGALGPRFP